MTLTKKLSPIALATSLAIAGMSAPMVASATGGSFSANAGIASDYLFRGISQTGGEAAVSGGIDWDSGVGFYVGTWASNVVGENEVDYYAGYGGSVGDFSYDFSIVALTYTQRDFFLDYEELVVGLGYGAFSFTYVQALDINIGAGEEDAPYIAVGVDLPINETVGFNATLGNWDFDNGDYTHLDVNITKAINDSWEASIGAAWNNDEDLGLGSNSDEVTFVVSVGTSFDL